jgi:hypothetical protein
MIRMGKTLKAYLTRVFILIKGTRVQRHNGAKEERDKVRGRDRN